VSGTATEASRSRDHAEQYAYGSRLGDLVARAAGWRAGMLLDPLVTSRWRWLARRARRGSVTTLDAGCGSGWFALYLASLGNSVTGVSFVAAANDAAERRAAALGETKTRFVEGDLRDLDEFGPSLGTFDQIIAFEIIEHIKADGKLVRDLADRLNPGGQLLLTTPHLDRPPLLGEEWSDVEDGGHVVFGYTHARLRELSEAAGLEVVEQGYLGGFVVQKLYNVVRRVALRIGFLPAMVVTLPLRPLQLLDRPVTRLLGYPGLCVSLVARKPVA
jgi:SAM-dependent methyltransferase